MLITILKLAFKALTIWIENDSIPMTVVISEITLVNLSIRPEELAFTMTLCKNVRTFVNAPIRPTVKPISIHFIILEHSLINFTCTIYTSPVSIKFPFLPIPLIQRLLIMNLDTPSIRIIRRGTDFTSILSSTPPCLPKFYENCCIIFIFVSIIIILKFNITSNLQRFWLSLIEKSRIVKRSQ